MRVVFISVNTEQINIRVLPHRDSQGAAATEKKGHEIKVLNLMRLRSSNKKIALKKATEVSRKQNDLFFFKLLLVNFSPGIAFF